MTKRFFDFPETCVYILYSMYIPITKTEEKCTGQLSYEFNIQDKLEGCTHEKKYLMGIWIFGILCTNVLELTGEHPCQILQVFRLFFGLIFKRISSQNKKLASLARTVPKPSAASLARTVPKPFKFCVMFKGISYTSWVGGR